MTLQQLYEASGDAKAQSTVNSFQLYRCSNHSTPMCDSESVGNSQLLHAEENGGLFQTEDNS